MGVLTLAGASVVAVVPGSVNDALQGGADIPDDVLRRAVGAILCVYSSQRCGFSALRCPAGGKNNNRRNLTPDQRLVITGEYMRIASRLIAEQEKAKAQFKAGNTGGPGGDRKSETAKSTVTPKSEQPLIPPKNRDRKKDNANSTAGKLAAETGTSVRARAWDIITIPN